MAAQNENLLLQGRVLRTRALLEWNADPVTADIGVLECSWSGRVPNRTEVPKPQAGAPSERSFLEAPSRIRFSETGCGRVGFAEEP